MMSIICNTVLASLPTSNGTGFNKIEYYIVHRTFIMCHIKYILYIYDIADIGKIQVNKVPILNYTYFYNNDTSYDRNIT